MSWTQLIISQHPTQKQQTPHSSQVHMEHSPGLTTCWATKQALVNRWNYIKHLFWSQCYAIRNKLQEKNSKKYQYMVHKQYATQQPLSHWRNQRGNKKKIPRDKWKQKHNSPKLMGCGSSSYRREDYNTLTSRNKKNPK